MSEEFEVSSEAMSGEKDGRLKQELFEWLQILVFCAVTAVLMFNCVARVSRVDGQSMDYTLRHNELLLVWSLGYSPKQGDIVILNKTTADFLGEHAIVKRVIATGGQTVDIDFDNGIVYVDGVALSEPYISSGTYLYEGTVFPLVVAKNHIFVLGDNRMNSKDSRSPEIGQIDCREVLGKAIFLIFPGADGNEGRELGRIGVID